MPAYRFYDPAPVFFDTLGVEKVENGMLTFYDIGTTNERDTWNSPDMLPINLNPNPVPCDAAGRASVNIFLDGDYTVKIEADNLDPITRDIVSGQSAGQTIPALETGEFLTNDGSNLLWGAIRQMPDPTGSSGQVPVTNGAGYTLQNLPSANASAITFPPGGIKISNGTTAWMIQVGNDTVAATGTSVAAKSITFGTEFSAPPRVFATINGGPGVANASGGIPTFGITGVSTSGASLSIDTNAFGSTININNPVPFFWVAIGTVAP